VFLVRDLGVGKLLLALLIQVGSGRFTGSKSFY